jgi:hypothetical protein
VPGAVDIEKNLSHEIQVIMSPLSSWPASVPAIHGSHALNQDVDARNKSAHDNFLWLPWASAFRGDDE